MKKSRIKLGVNIDHVATLRNARGENDPSIIEMMHYVIEGGADSITIHLREDRRHIRDNDVLDILKESKVPVNLEMALNQEILEFAVKHKPAYVCIVPEKRQEITTEGGLDLKKNQKKIQEYASSLSEAGINVYLFTDPDKDGLQYIPLAHISGIEVHTGAYARSFSNPQKKNREIEKLREVHDFAGSMGLEFHAGHGLNFNNIEDILFLENLTEVNIGHAIIADSLKHGLKNSVSRMKELLRV